MVPNRMGKTISGEEAAWREDGISLEKLWEENHKSLWRSTTPEIISNFPHPRKVAEFYFRNFLLMFRQKPLEAIH